MKLTVITKQQKTVFLLEYSRYYERSSCSSSRVDLSKYREYSKFVLCSYFVLCYFVIIVNWSLLKQQAWIPSL